METGQAKKAVESQKRSRGRKAEERLSRDDWIEAAWKALSAGSIEAIKVDKLARQMNVTRGSFYWHFNSRGELLEAVVDRWLENLGYQKAIAPLLSRSAPPEKRLWMVFEYVVRNISGPQSVFLRVWAKRSREVSERLAKEDGIRIEHFSGLFRQLGFMEEEAKARAENYFAIVMSEYLRHGHLKLEDRLKLARRQHDLLISASA